MIRPIKIQTPTKAAPMSNRTRFSFIGVSLAGNHKKATLSALSVLSTGDGGKLTNPCPQVFSGSTGRVCQAQKTYKNLSAIHLIYVCSLLAYVLIPERIVTRRNVTIENKVLLRVVMIPDRRIQLIRALIKQPQLSQRSVAELAKVSRDVVRRVALGKLRVGRPRRPPPEMELEELRPYVRCHKCGGRVVLPCRLCRLRARLARKGYEQKLERRREALVALEKSVRRRSA